MKFFTRFITFSTTRPVVTLAVVFLATLLLLPGIIGFDRIPLLNRIGALNGIGGIEQDNSNDGYLGSFSRFHIEGGYVSDTFGDNGNAIFIAVESENIYSYKTLSYVELIHKRLEETNTVTGVSSIINLKDVTGVGDSILTYTLIPEDENGNALIPRSETDLHILKERVESNELFESIIYSKVKNEAGIPRAWNISVDFEAPPDTRATEFVNVVEKILSELAVDDITTYLFGGDVLEREVDNSGIRDLITQVPLIVFIICLVYFLNFGTFSGVVFPITGNLISVIWTYAIIGYVGMKLAFIHLLLLPLLIALGSSYSIHLLNQYYMEAATFTEENKRRQIGATIRHILTTIALAGLTTFIGLFSNITNNLVHLRTFGVFAGVGVLLSVITALTFIPALLALKKIPGSKRRRNFNDRIFDRLIDRFNQFTIRRSKLVFAIGIAVLAVGVVGTFFVSSDMANTDYFVKEHKIRFLTKYFSDNFDGVETMSVVIDTRPTADTSSKNEIERRLTAFKDTPEAFLGTIGSLPNGEAALKTSDENPDKSDPFGDPFGDSSLESAQLTLATINLEELQNPDRGNALHTEILRKIDDLSRYAETIPGVGKTFSFVDLQKRFNFIMNNDDQAFKTLPDSDQTIIDYTHSFGGDDDNLDGLPDAFESFIDPSLNVLKITLKLKNIGERDLTTGDSKRIRDALINYIETSFEPESIYFVITGGSIAFMTIQNYIINGQILTIIFSLIVIAVVTSIIFKSTKVGLLAIIPLSLAVIVNFGVMGIFGIKLDIATALIASFAIGIGIDDTIHYLLNLRKEIKGLSNDELRQAGVRKGAIYNALRRTSKAIIFTSLALICGFTVVGFSSFLPIKYFSILVALTMVNATIATLFFLPSVLVLFPGLLWHREKKHHRSNVKPHRFLEH